MSAGMSGKRLILGEDGGILYLLGIKSKRSWVFVFMPIILIANFGPSANIELPNSVLKCLAAFTHLGFFILRDTNAARRLCYA